MYALFVVEWQRMKVITKVEWWQNERAGKRGVLCVTFGRISIWHCVAGTQPGVLLMGKSGKYLQKSNGPVVFFVRECFLRDLPCLW